MYSPPKAPPGDIRYPIKIPGMSRGAAGDTSYLVGAGMNQTKHPIGIWKKSGSDANFLDHGDVPSTLSRAFSNVL